jgi:hypothetical protein
MCSRRSLAEGPFHLFKMEWQNDVMQTDVFINPQTAGSLVKGSQRGSCMKLGKVLLGDLT